MRQLYEQNRLGDGFIAIKNMVHDTVHSYDAMQLSTGEKHLLIKRKTFFEDDFTVGCQIGPYLFNESTLFHIKNTVETLLKNKVSPIYLDEIGVLELENKGLHTTVDMLVKSNTALVLSMREDLVTPLQNKYKFDVQKIIKV